MKKIIFIGDFFVEDLLGGAEINDDTLIQMFIKEGMLYEKIHSYKVTKEYLMEHRDKLFVLTNCVRMRPDLVPVLAFMDYVIYEHDYKFVKNRNPAFYPNFQVPKSEIINYNFYNNAKSVICLAKMHREIFEKNLNIKNITNIHCSLFDDNKINLLLSLGKKHKTKEFAIIDSSNPTKRTQDTINWCNKNGIKFDLISHKDNTKFLEILSEYKNLVFMTRHPEPTPRIAVEAKLLGVNLIASKEMISVAHEYWWNWERDEIAKELVKIRQGALEMFKNFLKETEKR